MAYSQTRRAPALAGMLCLALMAACRGSSAPADSEPFVPKRTGAAARIRFQSAGEAARALLPNYTRTVPLSVFGGQAKNLAVGVRVAANTEMGKRFIGTVTAVGKDAVTVEVESWEDLGTAR